MRYAVALVCLLALSTAHADGDLMSVYQDALKSDPILREARANLQANQELRPQARSTLMPSVEAGADAAWTDVDQELDSGVDSNVDYTTTTLSLTLTQPIFRYSSIPLLRQAKSEIAAAEAALTAAEQELILRTAQRYFDVLTARDTLRFAESELEAIERQLEQAEQRFDVGLIAITDVQEARASRDLAVSRLIQARNDLANSEEALRELTARSYGALYTLRDQVPLVTPQPEVMAAWTRAAEEQNWSLAQAKFAAESAMHNIGVQRGDHFPTLDLVANTQQQDQSDGLNAGNTNSTTLQLTLNVPLFRGGRTNSEVRQAQYQYTAAQERLEAARRSTVRNAADAYRGVQSSIQQVRALGQARQSTRTALEAVEAGFEVGTRTIVDVLAAQREIFRAERDYQQARYAYLLSTLRLKLAAGSLAERDLRAVNALLVSTSAE